MFDGLKSRYVANLEEQIRELRREKEALGFRVTQLTEAILAKGGFVIPSETVVGAASPGGVESPKPPNAKITIGGKPPAVGLRARLAEKQRKATETALETARGRQQKILSTLRGDDDGNGPK